ncbi:hypothetical protein QYE76_043746 [Lolium multiflorum]|uniref:AP2/ERF domain-containing protein n=1 Tax=Lolium multiflorum TaxID=4521 RepID=A0AAD8TJN5_LOLMU|nr:hypothetical protein QYE76_043746 [Lolium multiflorum]
MAPCHRSNTGFIGVRKRPAGHFAAEITAGGARMWLDTFYTKEAVARAYDVAAWRFGQPRNEMNFPELRSLTEAQNCENEVETTNDGAPEEDYEVVYEEPDLSGGVEGVDYGIVYGADNNEADE